jgi:hypothetical protein
MCPRALAAQNIHVRLNCADCLVSSDHFVYFVVVELVCAVGKAQENAEEAKAVFVSLS